MILSGVVVKLLPNKAIKFAPYGRRTLVPRAIYGGVRPMENK